MERTLNIEPDGLDERKAEILKTVIDLYLEEPTPVASKHVSTRSGLGVSSATIRNEMHLLEEEGYLSHTHTSSGRIPTDRGYRFFVDNFVVNRVDPTTKNQSVKKINETIGNFVPISSPQLLDEMVLLLSTITEHTAVAISETDRSCVVTDAHVSLLAQYKLVIGLFFEDTTIDRVVLDLDRFSKPIQNEISQLDPLEYAQRCQKLLDENIVGKQILQIPKSLIDENTNSSLRSELLELVVQNYKKQLDAKGSNATVHVAGVSKIADLRSGDSHVGSEISTKVLGLVEQQMKLVDVIRNSLAETIDARIGSENSFEELRRHSMVLAPIVGLQGEKAALGIIGPTRMDYVKTFDAISAASQVVSRYMDQ